jgi:hypothetical protein
MKNKKEIKAQDSSQSSNIYKCEKCGYENSKTFLSIFENIEYRYCLKCVNDFYAANFPKAIKQ